MLGLTWKAIPGVRRGDWRARLLAVAQIAAGLVATLALLAMLVRSPLLLLGFTAAQGIMVVGIVLFVVVAIFAQRTLVLEEFDAGEEIFREGDPGRHVYVIKAGTVEVLARQADGSQRVINRLGPGDHFGEMALLRSAPRTATVRTATPAEIFKVSPGNFVALYTNLPGVREHFNKSMDERLREFGRRS